MAALIFDPGSQFYQRYLKFARWRGLNPSTIGTSSKPTTNQPTLSKWSRQFQLQKLPPNYPPTIGPIIGQSHAPSNPQIRPVSG
jgi:hypothetical protein